ncbi:unnamed protein product [Sphagnum jensenii]|uniref:DRBM domain-containing protein n=1 Tax=Sphagnum jensenii TaxID=128206 RepID=A0ABP1BS06_9BRYO
MYKNQLQELAQRSCFNLPAYACIREGPDHAPRFKATVNFNGEVFESPNYWGTLRQAEHAAAEVALNTLSRRGPSQSLAARILDETGVCKNLLQETAQRAGVSLPVYSTIRSGPGHLPVFTCVVKVAGLTFSGEAAKTKKQAEKNAAMAAWLALKQLANQGRPTTVPAETEVTEEQEQNTIARTLATAFYEASVPSVHSMPQPSQAPIGSSIPTRIRNVPRRDQGQGSGGVPPIGQYHHGSWLPDITIDQHLHHNQLHPSMVIRTAPSYRRVGPPCPGLTVALQDVPEALSRGYPTRAAMPVRVRPAVTVCAAPPPRCPVEQGDPESEGEAAAHKVMSQLRL